MPRSSSVKAKKENRTKNATASRIANKVLEDKRLANIVICKFIYIIILNLLLLLFITIIID